MPRYPKRKRNVVSYAEGKLQEGEGEAHEGDELEEDAWNTAGEDKHLTRPKRARYARKKENPFRFMDLPGELRNIIYNVLLCQPSGEWWIEDMAIWKTTRSRRYFTQGSFDNTGQRRAHLATTLNNFAILRVNKQVNAEAMGILYGQRLCFEQISAMHTFILRLSPVAIGLLRYVDCSDRLKPCARSFLPAVATLLRPAAGLERLIVHRIIKTQCMAIMTRILREPGHDGMTVATWDALIARELARAVYPLMQPYIEAAIESKGPEKTVEILGVFNTLFKKGPKKCDGKYRAISYRLFDIRSPNHAVWEALSSRKRSLESASAIRTMIGEELARLVGKDAART